MSSVPQCTLLGCDRDATRILRVDTKWSEYTEAQYCGAHEPAGEVIEERKLEEVEQ